MGPMRNPRAPRVRAPYRHSWASYSDAETGRHAHASTHKHPETHRNRHSRTDRHADTRTDRDAHPRANSCLHADFDTHGHSAATNPYTSHRSYSSAPGYAHAGVEPVSDAERNAVAGPNIRRDR